MFESGMNLTPERFRELEGRVQILDVREAWEFELAHLPGAVLIPLGQLAERLGELDASRPVAAYCHHGARSLQGLRILQGAGFQDIAHLAGGIAAYSRMDASIPSY